MNIIEHEPFDDEDPGEPDRPEDRYDFDPDEPFDDGPTSRPAAAAPLTSLERRTLEAMEDGRRRFEAAMYRPNLFEVRPMNDWLRIAKRRGTIKSLFGPLWCENDLTIMFADTGVGKSLFAVQIAEAIVRGRSRLGPFETKVRPQRVLVLDFEMTHRQFHDRYTDGGPGPSANAKRHDFAPGILRAEISWQAGVPAEYRSYTDFVLASIQECVSDRGVSVVIVDNISWLVPGGFGTPTAAALMRGLKLIKSELGISLLVLAHTVKRFDTKPITIDDLSGSKMLANFADNVFALGRSCYAPDIRYLKELKLRNSPIVHDESNVAVFRIVDSDAYPRFEFLRYEHESAFLRRRRDTLLELRPRVLTRPELVRSVTRLHAGGLSIRTIADRLNVSRSAVARIITKLTPKET